MGTYITGCIKIEPPLPTNVAKDLKGYRDGDNEDTKLWIHQHGDGETLGLVDGEMKIIPGSLWDEITARTDEAVYPERQNTVALDVAYELREIVAALVDNGVDVGDYDISGALYLEGEADYEGPLDPNVIDPDLFGRVYIVDAVFPPRPETNLWGEKQVEVGEVVIETPEFVWPNGDKGWHPPSNTRI